MNHQVESTQANIQPESGRCTPFTGPLLDDVEGHLIRKGGFIDESDTEAHFGRKSYIDETTQASIQPESGRWSPIFASAWSVIQPESGRYTPFTEPAPDDTEGHFGRKSYIDETDVEGHVLTFGRDTRPVVRVGISPDGGKHLPPFIEPDGGRRIPPFTEPAPGDTAGHGLSFDPEGGKRIPPFMDPEGGKKLPPFTEPAPDDVEGHVNRTDPPGIEPDSGRRPAP